MPVSLSALHTRAILLDIEGTTTPIAFVYQVLFPFARTHAAAFLEREGESPDVRAATGLLRAEQVHDRAQGAHPPDAIPDYVIWLMDCDRKSPGLKTLQGLIWQEGFRSGELQGEVYPDVPPALERWRAAGLDVCIYSSGSVLAQQLLFASTGAGDLTKFLTGHFDTAVGPKSAPASYRAIAARINVAASHVLFVSDVVAELDAAASAGMLSVLCSRDGAAPPGTDLRTRVHSFDEIR